MTEAEKHSSEVSRLVDNPNDRNPADDAEVFQLGAAPPP